MAGCEFRPARGGPGGDSECKQQATHRIFYRMKGTNTLIRDWRPYCKTHAERYAGYLRNMACMEEVVVREIESGPVTPVPHPEIPQFRMA